MHDNELYIAYYRVSTDKQGKSGLGLEAQQALVERFVQGRGHLVNSYIEVESGKKDQNRPEIQKALAECRKRKASLLLATLDRLGRKVHFISGLMESKVDFVCADMPNAGPFEIHIRAAMAEEEGRKISKRTKDALRAARSRGVKLGNPSIDKINTPRKKHADVFALSLAPIIEQIRNEGYKTVRAIREQLNDRNIPTAKNGKWHQANTWHLLQRIKRLAS